MKSILKRSIKKLLASHGYILARKDTLPHTMDDAFRAMVRRKHSFNTIIDVGASDGRWTSTLMDYFPRCQYLLIEAQPTHATALAQFSSHHPNVQFVLAAAGATSGHIHFNSTDPFGGQASYTPYTENDIQVPVVTIDHEVQSRLLTGPYLIKLDTHGFEVPILEGASRVLAETDVLIVECYNFRIAPECLLFFEMCQRLQQSGFRCIDLVDPFNRPYDDSFWQMDLVFVKDHRPEFSYLHYR